MATKNLKVLALILLASALLIVTMGTASVKSQTQASLYIFNSQGGTISGNGTELKSGTVQTYTSGDTVSFTTTPGSGYAFLCWVWSGATETTSISPTVSETINSSSCSIQALFVPITNATQTPSGSGQATICPLISLGGTTSPASTQSSYTNYTVGQTYTFTAIPDSGSRFLYWLVVSSQGSTYYTTGTLQLTVPASTIAIQAFFVPSSSSVVIPEYSSAALSVLVVVLSISAAGAFTYTRRNKKK